MDPPSTTGKRFSYGFGDNDDTLRLKTLTAADKQKLEFDKAFTKLVSQSLVARRRALAGLASTTALDLQEDKSHRRREREHMRYAFYGCPEPCLSSSWHSVSTNYPNDAVNDELMQWEPIPRPKKKRIPVHDLASVDVLNGDGGVPRNVSIVQGLRCCQDMRLFKGKSFKCGWMKGLWYIEPSDDEIYVGRHATSILNICRLDTENIPTDSMMNFMERSLENVYVQCDCEYSDETGPLFSIKKGADYLLQQVALFSQVANEMADDKLIFAKNVWRLCFVLWGPLDDRNDHRRQYLGEWLKQVVNEEMDQWQLKNNGLLTFSDFAEAIFHLLSTNRILEAAEFSMTNNYPQLSMLISQLNTSDVHRNFLGQQVLDWYLAMAEEFFPAYMKKIYLLMSGNAFYNDINTCENLDWKRAFGIHLWYVMPTNASIQECVSVYTEAFDNESEGYAQRPLPPYATNNDSESPYNMIYHILLLYCSNTYLLNHVLNQETHTADVMDCRLNWPLFHLFKSLELGLFDDNSEIMLHLDFANQLEDLNHWLWAIFALAFIKDPTIRKQRILGVLERKLTIDVNDTATNIENVLVHKFKIPPKWIHEVKAYKALHFNKYWLSYAHFAYADHYHDSNEIFVTHLLPDLCLNQQYEELKLAVVPLEKFERLIMLWPNQSGLVLDFFDLQEKFDVAESQEDYLELHGRLVSIMNRLPYFPDKTPAQKLCVEEISRKCASWQRILADKIEDPNYKQSFVHLWYNLAMPADCLMAEGIYYLFKMLENK